MRGTSILPYARYEHMAYKSKTCERMWTCLHCIQSKICECIWAYLPYCIHIHNSLRTCDERASVFAKQIPCVKHMNSYCASNMNCEQSGMGVGLKNACSACCIHIYIYFRIYKFVFASLIISSQVSHLIIFLISPSNTPSPLKPKI